LSSGVASARKSSTPASARSRGRERVVARDHDGADAHRAQLAKRSLMPPLTMSLRWMTPRRARPATTSGVPPLARDALDDRARDLLGGRAAEAATSSARPRRLAPLRICARPMSTPLMRVCAVNGTNCASSLRRGRARGCRTSPWRARRSSGPRASRRRATRAARRRRARASVTPGDRDELVGLAVAERDRAGLVEQQRVDVAGRLDRAARHREHVVLHERSMPAMPIAESSPPIVVGIRQTSSAISTVTDTSPLPE
jgi:hypothetical protein